MSLPCRTCVGKRSTLIGTPRGVGHWPGVPRRMHCVVGCQWQHRVDEPHGQSIRRPRSRLGRNPFRSERGYCNAELDNEQLEEKTTSWEWGDGSGLGNASL